MQTVNFNKQSGMTFIGLVLVIAAVICVAVVGMKVAPAYMEFFSVKKAIQHIASDGAFATMSKKDIETAFNKNADTGYITVIKGSDLIIEKKDTGNLVKAEYQVVLPIVANASILLDFTTSNAK